MTPYAELSFFHVLLRLQNKIRIPGRNVQFSCTYFSIIEERIHAPWVGLCPLVEVRICGNFGKVAVVLMFQVLQVFCMLCFGVIHPGYASCD